MTPEEFAKAKEHFLRLIDLKGRERSSALELIEAEDKSLAEEVRSLLDNHHRSRTIIQSNAATEHADQDSTSYSKITLGLHRWKFQLIGGQWPFVFAVSAAIVAGLAGWSVRGVLKRSLENANTTHLQSLIELEQSVINQWTNAVTLKVESWARSTEVRNSVIELVKLAENHSGDEEEIRDAIIDSPAHLVLEKELNTLSGIAWPSDLPPENCQKYAVWNRESYTLTDWNRRKIPEWIGRGCTPEGAAKLNRIFQNKAADSHKSFVYLPRAVANELITSNYPVETSQPQIQIMTGIRDDHEKVIATLMIRDQSTTDEFQQTILQGRFADTGECYLVDEDGWMMMSESRFAEQMKKHEVFRSCFDQATKSSKIRVADPGGDVLAGFEPSETSLQWPITKAARGVLAHKSGLDIYGYRDYRGRQVIGTWRWNDRLQAGIIVEQDYDEAFELLALIDRIVQVVCGLPLLCAVGIFVGSLARNWRQKGRPPAEIGPYRIVSKIGEGGLGIVYRGEHKLLGRPAAIKLIKKHIVRRETLVRFEREVRLASRLVHPNAVSIFDYGVSEQGEFYYAMEYVQGMNLEEFVGSYNVVPLDRCLNILIQICGAIREAHMQGLVHRDIKPQNIMIGSRGGLPDVIKVLDYGLVKSFVASRDSRRTETRVVMGTPKFMAPERLESPWLADPRIDIFSIGAVAYYLLMRNSPLLGMGYQGMLDLFSSQKSPYRQHINEKPFLQFIRLIARSVSPESTLRPESIDEVLELLRNLQIAYPWQELEAIDWWDEYESQSVQPISNQIVHDS